MEYSFFPYPLQERMMKDDLCSTIVTLVGEENDQLVVHKYEHVPFLSDKYWVYYDYQKIFVTELDDEE